MLKKHQKLPKRVPKGAQIGARITQKKHCCKKRATSMFAAIYSTLWKWSLPRAAKRCSKTASTNQQHFGPQKVTQKAPNGSQNASKLSSLLTLFLTVLSTSWDMGSKVLPRSLQTSKSDAKVLKNDLNDPPELNFETENSKD